MLFNLRTQHQSTFSCGQPAAPMDAFRLQAYRIVSIAPQQTICYPLFKVLY